MALYQVQYTQIVNGRQNPGASSSQVHANSEREAKEVFLKGKDRAKYKILGVVKKGN